MDNQLRIGESTRSGVTLDPTHRNAEASVAREEDEEEEEDDDVEEDTEKLQEEVKEMAKKVEEYRSTLPDHLKSCLASVLSSQRPAFSLLDDVSEPGPSCGSHSGAGSSHGNSSPQLEVDDGEKTSDEVQLLRDKISSNISAIPKNALQERAVRWFQEFFYFRLMAFVLIFLDLPHDIVSDGRAMGLVSA